MKALETIRGLLIFGPLAWKLFHLSRAPRDLPLRWVVACLGCAAAAYPVGMAFSVQESSPAGRWFMLIQCSLLLSVVFCLDCFFVTSLAVAETRSRTRGLAFTLAAAIAVLSAATLTVPPGIAMRDQSVPAVCVAYLAFFAFMARFLADARRWAQRGITEVGGPLSRGLRLARHGMTLMLAGMIPLAFLIAEHWAHAGNTTVLGAAGQFLVVVGIVIFLAGICYPGACMRVSAIRIWRHHHRVYRQLWPLWAILHEAYPQDALTIRVPASRFSEALSPWGVHRRYYRRVIECRDGLVRISPYLDRHSLDDDAALASRLVAALRVLPDNEASPQQPVPVAMPEGSGLDDDARELAALAAQVGAARLAASN